MRAAFVARMVGSSAAAGIAMAAAPDDWPQFARSPQRIAVAGSTAALLAPPRWVRGDDGAGATVAFIGQAGAVTDGQRVYVVGRVNGSYRVFALRAADGGVGWSRPVPAPYVDSWSTPAVDAASAILLVAAGRFVSAFDSAAGTPRWQAMLDRNVVNASPLVTADRGPADRAFITDYDGFGGSGRLYCINIDPFDAGANPYQPGQVVWSVPIGGSSGNTPAYAGGVVYVTSITDPTGLGPGRVMAFDAGALAAPPPLWVTDNPTGLPFFGGVCVSDGAVYAASYAVSGGQRAANLVKIDAPSGAVRWSVPCNRTDSTPIPIGGRIIVSGGIFGFGCAPSIQLFRDDGASATLLWDTALDTWQDLNHNTLMDPGEYLLVGGWTHLPVVAGGRLYAGAITDGTTTFGPCTDLYALDLARGPAEPGFVIEHVPGMGTTPALAGASLYTVGAAGLYALGGPCYANCDGSTALPLLNVNDFVCFQARFAAGDPYANCDGSTMTPALNVNDFICFQTRFAGGCP